MHYFAAIDVSLEQSSVCVIDDAGRIVREEKVASDPDALVAFFRRLSPKPLRLGLEAGPLSHWIHGGLTVAGFSVVLIETRHVKAALSAMRTKTDRNDARGMAQLLRMGWLRPVHPKTLLAQELRALLTARKQLQAKLLDLESCLRGLLRGFGLKLGAVAKGQYEGRVRELITGQAMLERIVEPLLRARSALRAEFAAVHRDLLNLGREDEVCHRLMTIPGVGPVVAMTFKATIDDPRRFKHSKAIGAHLGLTPRKYQSGEVDRTGSITKIGDGMARAALYEAATALLMRSQRWSTLRSWAVRLAERRGRKRATVALARKLAIVMHRVWVDGSTFRWTNVTVPTST